MPQENMSELAAQLKETHDKVKGYAEKVEGQMKKGEKLGEELKGDVDEALKKMGEIATRLDEVEQKQARKGEQPQREKSAAEQLIESEQFKSFCDDPGVGKSARINVKANALGSATTGAGGAGLLVEPQRLPGIQTPPMQRLTVRDLLTPGNTDSNSITYIRETGFTNAAATVAEFGKKPQSTLEFEDVSTNVKVIAHFVKASRQILDDAAMLQSYVEGRLAYGLKLVEEKQLLNGDGTGSNIHGIIPQATAFADPATLAKYTIIDQLRLAMLQATLAEYPATGHVLNPIDWAKIELEKDGEGRYIIGQPQGTASPTLWGLPVVSTQSIAAGKFLTGAFKLGAQIFDRWAMSIAVATQNEDDFIKNMVTILCEERLALAVYRPEAFIYGDLAAKV